MTKTSYSVALVMNSVFVGSVLAQGQPAPDELSKMMNSIPPSKQYFCVGNGLENLALHPDRAPHTDLAMQDGIVLFSGTAPQLGLNFTLSAGSLIYRNQMSTLGGPEPPPAVGTAGALLQQGHDTYELPWAEARWHPGEDITFTGSRGGEYIDGVIGAKDWISSVPHFDGDCGDLCPDSQQVFEEPISDLYHEYYWGGCRGGSSVQQQRQHSAATIAYGAPRFDLQLSRGIYQTVLSSTAWLYPDSTRCPFAFREPWFQGRAYKPVYNVRLDTDLNGQDDLGFALNSDGTVASAIDPLGTATPSCSDLSGESCDFRLGAFATKHLLSKYTYREVELEGGQLKLDFGRSASYPRTSEWQFSDYGIQMANRVYDEYDNQVVFDRVPAYGYETDYKMPQGNRGTYTDPSLGVAYHYIAKPQSWRMPHKRVRSVQLYSADDPNTPDWTVVFVHEHPQSDRISTEETADQQAWQSIYSNLKQADWVGTTGGYLERANLPPINDETTLLTVQAYVGDVVVNGAAFQDDQYVWGSPGNYGGLAEAYQRLNGGIESLGDANGDGCPGVCGVDDDQDGLVDEDCQNREPSHASYGNSCASNFLDDDDENGIVEYENPPGTWHGINDPAHTGLASTDPRGDANGDGCPGVCGIDDDSDGLIDEDSNDYQEFLNFSAGSTECNECTAYFQNNDSASVTCEAVSGLPLQTHIDTGCPNPLYGYDFFASYDDDEDGLFDEDGADDPLLVDLRSIDAADHCATGHDPYVPSAATLPGGSWNSECRPVASATADPWTYQVQYVYARSNPYWLLLGKDADGKLVQHGQPTYYYHGPFTEPFTDDDGDGVYDPGESYEDLNGDLQFTSFPGVGAEPNVHPDCLPNHVFQASIDHGSSSTSTLSPSGINLIKRIVRSRPDASSDPNNIIEQTWLYRYGDTGFLKGVFDPASVQALIDDDDRIATPDDILKYADTEPMGQAGSQKPLFMYASQWYTYYTPYVWDTTADERFSVPNCYELAPYYSSYCADEGIDADEFLGSNECDGLVAWDWEGYADEYATDPDCSSFMRQDCGFCFARNACGAGSSCSADFCTCDGGPAIDDLQLAQMGIAGAQPRMRKSMIKTARIRGADGEMHLYRFDYLGAANSAYVEGGRITSYADPQSITIVDELVEQTDDEYSNPDDFEFRSEFYIYEDDFRMTLDPLIDRFGNLITYDGNPQHTAETHYFNMPVKVKTRRVVTMNYYGIAISDRLIVTPGYLGDQISLVNDQQYEMVNTRGQAKQIYDPSWVATFRDAAGDALETLSSGLSAVTNQGRVLVELFGGGKFSSGAPVTGEGGWDSVFKGIAWGSGGGYLYNQQCHTPDVMGDVPTQRVSEEQTTVISVNQQFERYPDSTDLTISMKDMPEVQAVFYHNLSAADIDGFDINDPAGTLGDLSTQSADGSGCVAISCDCEDPDCTDYGSQGCLDYLAGIDLHNQDPVEVIDYPTGDTDLTGAQDDGVSEIRYAYEFWPTDGSQKEVRWKWRWLEKVSADRGGSDNVALEMWFFDENGRIRFHGKGSGVMGGLGHPDTATPFLVTYYGYDDLGRQALQVSDFDPTLLTNNNEDALFWSDQWTSVVTSQISREDPSMPQNLIVRQFFDDIGTLTSRYVGFDGELSDPLTYSSGKDSDFLETPDEMLDDITRTDFAVISNRSIYRNTTLIPQPVWTDPHTYLFEYQQVTGSGSSEAVHGTTTVTVLDKAGKFIESRTVARAGDVLQPGSGQNESKIDIDLSEQHWGIELVDVISNDWYDGVDFNDPAYSFGWDSCDDPPAGCTPVPPDCDCDGLPDDDGALSPGYPGSTTSNPTGIWPPEGDERLVTLARHYKQYNQSSTIKPTHEFTFNRFEDGALADEDRQLITYNLYDLEDRIGRQEQPDGTINRFLFDDKRRPTKVYKGSEDGCTDWFPVEWSSYGGDDDMVLVEHNLYNDGIACREYNASPSEVAGQEDYDPCSAVALGEVGPNTNFPNNANQLVRVRNYSDAPDSCATAFEPETASRDTQLIYDWRGRPVISKQVAVGYQGGSVASPIFISATMTIFDNLDRALVTATWDELVLPTLDQIDDAAGAGWAYDIQQDVDSTIQNILAAGPLSLSQMLYDERGRVYEQRTYNVSDVSGQTYSFTRTYRDDLDRVIQELNPQSLVQTTYDTLGRVLSSSTWTYTLDGALQPVLKTELMRSETTYDAVGNVLTQTTYDRMYEHIDDEDALITSGAGMNCIATYTYNWYDLARRLSATANFGTGGTHGYTNDLTIPAYDRENPPIWLNGFYEYPQGTPVTNEILINQFGYDTAGRRIWTKDPRGIVSRTWYDLQARMLLQAENYKDFVGNMGPGGSDLTPDHSGEIRYTAYHYTRGGLLDMIVAILPDDPEIPFDLQYADIDWAEDSQNGYAATQAVLTAGGAAVQATQYVYGADILNETDHAVLASVYPSMIREIRYPETDSGTLGQPSTEDKLGFAYTISGQIAQRSDQRGITLDFDYGTCATCPPAGSLTGVRVSEDQPGLTGVDVRTDELQLTYDVKGQLLSAKTLGSGVDRSEVQYAYDLHGNLLSETLEPTGSISGVSKVTGYTWDTAGINRNRLAGIDYPVGRAFELDYGTAGSSSDLLHRSVGLDEVDPETSSLIQKILAYQHTGGGRTVAKAWGPQTVFVDYKTGGLDRFGRMQDLDFQQNATTTIQRYQYGYDASGNRLHARIDQLNHANDRSYLYGYDELNRLISADRGALDPGNTMVSSPESNITWDLDLLGNRSRPGGRTETGLTPSVDVHTVNEINEIVSRDVDGVVTPFVHDDAGNLIDDGNFTYTYDAWNRIVKVDQGALTVAEYDYDAIGRRIRKVVPAGEYFYYYDGHRMIEEYQAVEQASQGGNPGVGVSRPTRRPAETGEHKSQLTRPLIKRGRRSAGSIPIRAYVYGANYVDELVAQLDLAGTPDPADDVLMFVLQDANYNVIALTDVTGSLLEQYTYTPYGQVIAAEDATGQPINLSDGLDALATNVFHQGLHYDAETGLYYNLSRFYSPSLERFMQRDPNETAMLLYTAIVFNARSKLSRLRLRLSAGAQYRDGMSTYQYLGSNPLNGTDPMGLFRDDYNIWDEIDDAIFELQGERIAALGAAFNQIGHYINQGLLIGEAVLPLLPGGQAILLAGKLASGADISVQDVALELAAAAAFGAGSAFALKALGKVWSRFSRNRAIITRSTSCLSSFSGETVVAMGDGTFKPIDRVLVGERVLSANVETGIVEPQVVEVVLEHAADDIIEITIGGQTLTTTSGHPFWVIGKGWQRADQLGSEDRLLSAYGEALGIESIACRAKPMTVYNLQIAKSRTYFVTTSQLLVHNRCFGDSFEHFFGSKKDIWGASTRSEFKRKVLDHIDQATDVIGGTYRGTTPGIHYFNRDTRMWAFEDEFGEILTGWKLGPGQESNLFRIGNVQ